MPLGGYSHLVATATCDSGLTPDLQSFVEEHGRTAKRTGCMGGVHFPKKELAFRSGEVNMRCAPPERFGRFFLFSQNRHTSLAFWLFLRRGKGVRQQKGGDDDAGASN